ncbi:hypothetical protein LBMAG53_26780 [Planctomycetota bacterium]|nr:hypothetical protein LBMAG53_26780 [Planctomycetota bacterium]
MLSALLLTGFAMAGEELDAAAIRRFTAELCAIPDRAQGRPGAEAAAKLISERLSAFGLAPILVRHAVGVPVDRGCTLTVGDRTIPLTPLGPNRVASPGTLGKTLSGPLLFAGDGSFARMSGKIVAGAIVVLDADSRQNWTTAAMLGAQAVIVLGRSRLDQVSLQPMQVMASIAFPRFTIDELDPALDGTQVTLRGEVVWEQATAHSVCALIKPADKSSSATSAALATRESLSDPAQPGELVILTAGYEANGPTANVGATRAVNAAILLDLARCLAAAPVERAVLVVFNGGRGDFSKGLREIVATLAPGSPSKDWLTELLALERRQRWQTECMLKALDPTGPFAFATALSRLDGAMQGSDIPPVSTLDDGKLPPARVFGRVLSIAAGETADRLLPALTADQHRWGERTRQPLADAKAFRAELDRREIDYTNWRTLQQKLDSAKPLTIGEDASAGQIAERARSMLSRQGDRKKQRIAELESLVELRRATNGWKAMQLIGLDLSDGNDRFAANSKGFNVGDEKGDPAWLIATALPKLAKEAKIAAFDHGPAQQVKDSVSWWPSPTGVYLHEFAAAGHLLFGAQLATTCDLRLALGSPADVPEQLRWSNLDRQTRQLAGFLRGWVNLPSLTVRRAMLSVDRLRTVTVRAEVRAIGTKVGTRGLPFPTVLLQYGRNVPQDWHGDGSIRELVWGDLFGATRLPMIPGQHEKGDFNTTIPLSIYSFDEHGGITAVVAAKGRQKLNDSADLRLKVGKGERLADQLALLVESEPHNLFQIIDPRLLAPLREVRALAASSDSEPNLAQIEVANGQAVVFAEPDTRLRIIAGFNKFSKPLVLTGKRSGGARGNQAAGTDWTTEGLGGPVLSSLTAADVGDDEWRLNNQRLELLRSCGIDSDSLVMRHAAAEKAVIELRAAREAKAWDKAQAAGQTAWAISGRIHPGLLGTANDVVYGLVVLLFFAIPFSIICERLFVSGATIGRKVAGFSGFFIVVFLFFWLFHPAFALATTPMVVFLAFLILLMSAWVIGIVLSRFELEMQRMRLAGFGQHAADVSRLGTLVATMGLGISNMRRRQLRTALTCATVVLMTFILLTFSSFTPSVVNVRSDISAPPSHSGILLRHNGWAELDPAAVERIRLGWGDRFQVEPVVWLSPKIGNPKIPINVDGGQSSVDGAVGITKGDRTGTLGALVRGPLDDPASPRGLPDGDGRGWIFLPEAVFEQLRISPGSPVRIQGLDLTAGVIDARLLAAARHLGDSEVTPPSLEGVEKMPADETSNRLQYMDASGNNAAEVSSAIFLGANSVAVLAADDLARIGGKLRGLSLIPRSPGVDIPAAADQLAVQLAMTVRAASAGEQFSVVSVNRLGVSGLGSVLVPLILGGLIIFSTMLNSVAERGREIFIYASLGLAPVHVAALFLVEAGIYAVLGGLGGYMLAQLTTAALGFAAAQGWAVQPDLNYSSFTAVATILLVMATVLASALYPALVAARAANPGTKEFVLPVPQGDVLDLDFPFTVASRDVAGLLAFLCAWFEQNNEASTGCFTAAEARVVREGEVRAVEVRTWLAPFDLGISQRFRLECRPTDMAAIAAVHVRLELLSGQRSDWRSANLAFMKALRHQFLIWRTLSPATQADYRAKGLA